MQNYNNYFNLPRYLLSWYLIKAVSDTFCTLAPLQKIKLKWTSTSIKMKISINFK
jgi:hypothetical protein